MRTEEVTIIGAGPAGLAAAIQLKRCGFEPLLLEREAPGGLLRNANLVENYPGFPGGISGAALVKLFEEQARTVGVSVTRGEVYSLDYDGEVFLLRVGDLFIRSRVVVVASGTKARRFSTLQIPPELSGRVFYHVYPLLAERDRQVAIIGSGDAAFDYALNLARNNQVTIVNRGAELKCLPLLWDRAKQEPSIRYLENTAVSELKVAGEGMELVCDCQGEGITISAHYLIGAIGREPQLDFLSENLQEAARMLEKNGKLYFVGDVVNGIYRQTSISVADGIKAAMKIYRCSKDHV